MESHETCIFAYVRLLTIFVLSIREGQQELAFHYKIG